VHPKYINATSIPRGPQKGDNSSAIVDIRIDEEGLYCSAEEEETLQVIKMA
jgi:hypothetical protein